MRMKKKRGEKNKGGGNGRVLNKVKNGRGERRKKGEKMEGEP